MADWVKGYTLDVTHGGDTVKTAIVNKMDPEISTIYDHMNDLKDSFTGTTAPTSPSTGQWWFDSDEKRMKRYSVSDWIDMKIVHVADYSGSLGDAVSGIGSDNTVLMVSTDVTLSSNLTIPANIILSFTPGSKITIDSGKTLTIEEGAPHFTAPLTQVFDGDGSVSFGKGSVEAVYPEWWGIDGTDDHTEINKAISALQTGIVKLTQDLYTTGGTITMKSNVALVGETRTSVKAASANPETVCSVTIKLANSSNCDMVSFPDGIYTSMIKGVAFNGNKANQTSTCHGIHFAACTSITRGSNTLEDVVVAQCNGHGIYVEQKHYEVYLVNVASFDNAQDGVRLYGTQDNTLLRVLSGENGRNGITLVGNSTNGGGADRMYNCDFFGNGTALTGNEDEGSGVVVKGNYLGTRAFGLIVNGNKYNGILFEDDGTAVPSRCTFVGCSFFGNSQASDGTYSNARMKSSISNTPNTLAFIGCSFENNTLSSPQPKYGIEDNTTSNYNLIAGCVFLSACTTTGAVNANVKKYWKIDGGSIDASTGIAIMGGKWKYLWNPTSPYDVSTDDEFIAMNTGTGAKTCNLPKASNDLIGKRYIFKRWDSGSSNALTIHPASGDSIDGSTSDRTTTTPWGTIKVLCDGANSWTMW